MVFNIDRNQKHHSKLRRKSRHKTIHRKQYNTLSIDTECIKTCIKRILVSEEKERREGKRERSGVVCNSNFVNNVFFLLFKTI